ncbi:TetR/AcrR family transcriptional regulator [Armatimonas rosea]|uniref:AcrR family transcriptional regulator n=1 Tax=Armatimonas rosea TaxID=685828 RepID=A0A7W9SRZ8_ARMRO|nr:TetR/AcrR family transcriptional regulator [Armatimonas rosea]MBB6050983.1 AcrR family transcriptional regulator [Armatimonas rosea]
MAIKENNCGGGEETRRAILEVARKRFLHYGFKKTTIDEIAADAGIGKGTVYLYFDNKEELLLTLAREVKRNVTDQMRAITESLASPEEKLRRMLLAAVLSVHDVAQVTVHGTELVNELLSPRLMECGQPERKAQLELLTQVLTEGDFDLPGTPTEAASLFLLAMVPFFPPYLNPCHASPSCRRGLETQANAMLDFLLHGIRRR